MKISYDNVKSLALLSGAVVVTYAAYRAYKVADNAKTIVTDTVAAVAGKVSGAIKSVSDGFEYAGNLVTGNLPVSPSPLSEAQTTENLYRDAIEIDRVENNRRSNWAREQAEASNHGLVNPMGDTS